MDRVERMIEEIKRIKKEYILVAIDGRCASGKSTLASLLQERLNCDVIHMDDFFLQPHQQTDERYEQAGGNIDYERFLEEVLVPLNENHMCHYHVYDCMEKKMVDERKVERSLVIIEGSYSCHPLFEKYYDLKVFLDVPEDVQLERLKKRDPKKVDMFVMKWIPLEEKYIKMLLIKEGCQLVFDGI